MLVEKNRQVEVNFSQTRQGASVKYQCPENAMLINTNKRDFNKYASTAFLP
jgi:hypothetical protein